MDRCNSIVIFLFHSFVVKNSFSFCVILHLAWFSVNIESFFRLYEQISYLLFVPFNSGCTQIYRYGLCILLGMSSLLCLTRENDYIQSLGPIGLSRYISQRCCQRQTRLLHPQLRRWSLDRCIHSKQRRGLRQPATSHSSLYPSSKQNKIRT